MRKNIIKNDGKLCFFYSTPILTLKKQAKKAKFYTLFVGEQEDGK